MATSASERNKPFYDVNDAEALFEKFVKDFDKSYKDDADREEHYQAFIKSLHRINELNSKDGSATYGINKFADYSAEESKQMRGMAKRISQSVTITVITMSTSMSNKPIYDINNVEELFEKFIKDFDRQYKDEAEREKHYW
ncbi:Viral cathepsin [Papilio machaon]|uniref:Viral cathepsin n=1 Tax=Papilio machaon TaxID=76193 RepID=A0A0N0PD72_PAPMA|nr:Viral cathepsin [Papilio machaon]